MPDPSPSPASPDLAQLIALTARADRAAFRMLYDRTSAKLFGVVLRIVKDRAMAEDVIQEVYLQLWRHAGRYEAGTGQPMTWLISIARYRAIDAIRSRASAARPLQPLDDSHERVAAAGDAEGELIDRDRLAICLGALEPEQRDCVLLAYRDGYSREELAAQFAKPVNTIKTWLHRGLQSLRTCLDAP